MTTREGVPIVEAGEVYTIPYFGELTVLPQSPTLAGNWVDVTTGEVFRNQLHKDHALDDFKAGKRTLCLGWLTHDSTLEVP